MESIKRYSTSLISIFLCFASSTVNAHVKWFTAYDLNSPPRPLLTVLLNSQFLAFVAITTVLMFIVAYLDRSLIFQAHAVNRFLGQISQKTHNAIPLILRLGVAGFLLAVANEGGTILTPELTTTVTWIVWVQIALALMALHHKTALITGVGILFLYLFALKEYGLFHVLDYPIFIGIAIYLIIFSLKGRDKQATALAVLRIATGVTLLWASIEKWAFPEWSFGIIEDKPAMTMGLSRELFMMAAGFVEFGAAFLLITGHHSSKVSALLLLIIFTSAISSFGYIDAVGHSGIIVVLIILLLSDNTVASKFDIENNLKGTAMLHGCWYISIIFSFYLCYYIGYYAEYNPSNL